MVLGVGGIAYGLIEFDAQHTGAEDRRFPLLFGVGAEGSRGMLTAIAGSMLTVAALTFSLTLSAISQVSSQYSPRILRNFMAARSNQVVMGYFVAVFTYCLIVLGTIRGTEEQKFVPATAVLAGLLLALGGVAALIFFIHHIAESLQTGTIVQNIVDETTAAIEDLFPAEGDEPIGDTEAVEKSLNVVAEHTEWRPLRATQCGYLQQISTKNLLEWATRHQAVVHILEPIGAFVGKGAVLMMVCRDTRPTAPPTAEEVSPLLRFVTIDRHRNVAQDVAFGIQQLVDIALKALSPGINDTTTAIMAIDYLSEIMAQLAERNFASRVRSHDNRFRVFVQEADFDSYVTLGFDLIRINAKGNHAVFRRLLRALALVSSHVREPGRKSILRKQAQLIITHANQTLSTEYEKEAVRHLYDELKPIWA